MPGQMLGQRRVRGLEHDISSTYFILVTICKIFKERDLHTTETLLEGIAPVQAQADPNSGPGPAPALTKVYVVSDPA